MALPVRGSINRRWRLLAAALCLFAGGCPANFGNYLNSDLQLAFNVEAAPALSIIEIPVHQSQLVFDSIAGRVGSHAPTITAFPDGEMLAAWYSYTGPGELDDSAIYIARRPAGQTAWTAPQVHLDRQEPEGNPVLYSEGDNVWMFSAVAPIGWSSARIEWQISVDRGQTWSSPVVIDGPIGSNVRFPPLRTTEGELLLPAYDDLWKRALFFVSADGRSWSVRSHVSTDQPFGNIQPSFARLDSGRLLAVMRNSGRQFLWVMASDDSGRTWSSPVNAGFANPDSPACLLRLASGRLLLVFNDSPVSRRPLSASLSADDGRSWTAPRILVDGDGDYAYPTVVQTPDGLVHILYSNNRANIAEIMLNEAWLVGS